MWGFELIIPHYFVLSQIKYQKEPPSLSGILVMQKLVFRGVAPGCLLQTETGVTATSSVLSVLDEKNDHRRNEKDVNEVSHGCRADADDKPEKPQNQQYYDYCPKHS